MSSEIQPSKLDRAERRISDRRRIRRIEEGRRMQQTKRRNVLDQIPKVRSVKPTPTIAVHSGAVFQTTNQKRQRKRTHRTNPEPPQNLRQRHPAPVLYALRI